MKKILFSCMICLAGHSVMGQIGKVGINTTTPSALLHVKDSSVLFQGGGDVSGTPGNPPISGGGVRMMWYPDKAAFRVGFVLSTYWNKDSIGNYSFASGNTTKATASGSTAMGYQSWAIGTNSTAMGNLTLASGNHSTAMGSGAIASGLSSTAMGNSTSAAGNTSTAMGTNTTASGSSSTAMGNNTIASGTYSTAMGNITSATGNNSTAAGTGTEAIGISSTALGNFTSATGNSSTALGNGTYAYGNTSTSMGINTTATGDYSTAMGYNTTARSYASFSAGRYNDSIISSSTSTWISTDPVFIIGNGSTDISRSNALIVYKNGNTTLEGSLSRPSSGTDKNLLPICYGSVTSGASITSGTSNFSVASSSTGMYEITMTGENYSTSGYTVNVTVASGVNPRLVTTNASGDDLVVRIYDIAGAPANNAFHFVVYKQ